MIPAVDTKKITDLYLVIRKYKISQGVLANKMKMATSTFKFKLQPVYVQSTFEPHEYIRLKDLVNEIMDDFKKINL